MRVVMLGCLLAATFVFAGCASGPGSESASGSEVPPQGQSFAVSQNNPLYAVKSRMTPTQVRKVVGEPDSSHSYTTGKQWIPFYFGSDTTRTQWDYDGHGYVVFSRNRYSGGLSVINVSSDTSPQ